MDVDCQQSVSINQKFAVETPGLCCLSVKVKLPLLVPPPESLCSLLYGETLESRNFLANTQKYNVCFQMTSFGAEIIEEHGYNPTFKIQGQICHRIGSLQPIEDAQFKLLQIYFKGSREEQLDRRQGINTATICALVSGGVTTKKVSSMNYYAYRLMIRENSDNYLLRFRRLLQQYCVDMYVKIGTERLTFIPLNQAKLRLEEYIHLRDAISTEGDSENVGRLTILPATYVYFILPRHLHEYAQDAMT
ncbi:uncharacterized protein LOC129944971 [Eupeodes corollae]|uniref:uncharacterized protein LOC129944971 n=1 Tax=Eupeodes corollae TaxID=290404 RepID=UPI002493C658|nr:uncharacterized protein LOC129944971 [Eupeodes corollae]